MSKVTIVQFPTIQFLQTNSKLGPNTELLETEDFSEPPAASKHRYFISTKAFFQYRTDRLNAGVLLTF